MNKNFKKLPPPRPPESPHMADNQPEAEASGGVRETFTAFYEGWLTKHEEFLGKLLECLEGGECRELTEKVLGHYEEFFNEKCKAAKEDVFVVMSPPWFSSLERTLIWISAFKPSMLFAVMKNSSLGKDLSADQTEKIDKIKAETRKLEKEIEEKLAKVQESVAGGNAAFEFLRRYGKLIDGEIPELDTSMDELKASMMMVMENADGLRGLTARKIMEVLKPLQNVKLLSDFGQLLVQVRRLGIQKDAQRAISSTQDSTSHA